MSANRITSLVWWIVIVLVLTAARDALALQTRVFKGRIITVGAGAPLPGRVTIRLGNFGTTESNDGGFFSLAIPAQVQSFVIQVDTRDPQWILRYPTGPVPVPTDSGFVTEVVVGPSIDAALMRAYAVEHAVVRRQLEQAGLRDSLVLVTMDGIRREFAARTQLEGDSLAIAEQRQRERAREYGVITSALEDYGIKLHNVEIAFEVVLEYAFTGDSAFAQIKLAIQRYNEAFERLKTGRGGFEQNVGQYWGSDRLVGEIRAVLDYALGEIHQSQILPLNDVIPEISLILTRQIRGEAAQSRRDAVTRHVEELLRNLTPRMLELDRRKDRLLAELQVL